MAPLAVVAGVAIALGAASSASAATTQYFAGNIGYSVVKYSPHTTSLQGGTNAWNPWTGEGLKYSEHTLWIANTNDSHVTQTSTTGHEGPVGLNSTPTSGYSACQWWSSGGFNPNNMRLLCKYKH
jgi:hypothetical protein